MGVFEEYWMGINYRKGAIFYMGILSKFIGVYRKLILVGLGNLQFL